jgi:hypothetical protein
LRAVVYHYYFSFEVINHIRVEYCDPILIIGSKPPLIKPDTRFSRIRLSDALLP